MAAFLRLLLIFNPYGIELLYYIQINITTIKHSTLNTQHSTLNTQHSTLNTQHSTLNTQHSTLITLLLPFLLLKPLLWLPVLLRLSVCIFTWQRFTPRFGNILCFAHLFLEPAFLLGHLLQLVKC